MSPLGLLGYLRFVSYARVTRRHFFQLCFTVLFTAVFYDDVNNDDDDDDDDDNDGDDDDADDDVNTFL